MRSTRLFLISAGLAAALVFDSCSSGSSGKNLGTMFVESCSLGCTNGKGGEQVFCAIVNTYQNQEISILFSEDVDLASVSASSFRVVNVANGTTPVGTFLIDPFNAKRLVFRPDLSFDLLGNPEFGLEPDTSYQITLPGEAQGDTPPFIESIGGRRNQSRVDCTILTDQGIVDPVPGPPQLDITVDVVTDYDADGNPIDFDFDVPADGAENVSRTSDIVFTFHDIMNVATLLNPSTGEATFITVSIDPDGQLGTTDDRVPVTGTFFYNLDLERLETILVFRPTDGYPSAGSAPRRIVINVPEGVLDLAGNSVTPESGGGIIAFQPERVAFPPLELPREGGEDFSTQELYDASESGAAWGSGKLAHSTTSSSGRLGHLRVRSGESVVLDTDSQAFPLENEPLDVIGNADAQGDFPTTVTVTDGTFEFTSIQIDNGGQLSFTGSNPPRLLSRGPIVVDGGGLISAAGGAASAHTSNVPKPAENPDETNGIGGPDAGDGGYGADRWDATGAQYDILRSKGAISNPGAVTTGRNGSGVGDDAAEVSRGRGGVRFPLDFPINSNLSGSADIAFLIDEIATTCYVRMVGNAGTGGGYSLPTEAVVSASSDPIADDPAGDQNQDLAGTPGAGQVSGLNLEPPDINNTDYLIRLLNPNPPVTSGGLSYPYYLRGGAGGGGGGMHPYGGKSGEDFIEGKCKIDGLTAWIEWHDHSGGAGGGGGGGIQLRSGTNVSVEGRVDASGGDGGSSVAPGSGTADLTTDFASPGGAASGGSILVQSTQIALGASTGRLDATGGTGGQGQGILMIVNGGDGSPGLIRLEDASSRTPLAMNQQYAISILPFDDGGVDGDFDADGDYAGPGDSVNWLSAAPGAFVDSPYRPESYSGAVSCWIRPSGNFYSLNFADDIGTDPDEMGWNMDVYWMGDTAGDLIPFRGDNGGIFGGNDFETEFGNTLNHADDAGAAISPICVRFQGVRLTGVTNDLCDVDLNGANVVSGSLTPWVDHPSKLNEFAILPNAIRFCVIFDLATEVGASATNVHGVTNLIIRANPD
jgi:hypothetical protein